MAKHMTMAQANLRDIDTPRLHVKNPDDDKPINIDLAHELSTITHQDIGWAVRAAGRLSAHHKNQRQVTREEIAALRDTRFIDEL